MNPTKIKNQAVRERYETLYDFARQRRERVAQLRAEGWTNRQIADAEGVSPQRINAIMKRYMEDHPKELLKKE